VNPNKEIHDRNHLSAIRLAGRFLLPFREDQFGADADWRLAGRWLIVWGLLIGILYAAVFRMTWRFFGEYQYIRFVPAACVLAIDLAFGGYRLLAAFISVVARPQTGTLTLPGVLAVVLIALVKYAMLLSIPTGVARSMESGEWSDWLTRFGILYPQAIYRPLVLMPLWGRWAMTLALSIGRCAPESSSRLRDMAAGVRLPLIMTYWLLGAALTVLYSSGAPHSVARGTVIALLVMVAAYATSFILARRHGGQTEVTVGATGLVSEIAFLALYLSISSRIYWY